MEYYFPISINNGRRLHVLHLQEKKMGRKLTPSFSFIVKNHDSPILFSVKARNPKLIAAEGGASKNIDLDNHCFQIEKIPNEPTPTFKVSITRGKPQEGALFIKSQGQMNDEDDNYARVSADSSCSCPDTFIILFSYTVEEKKKVKGIYEDAVTFCLYEDDKDLTTAALDFGSEASQIELMDDNRSLPILEELLNFRSVDQKDKKEGENDSFWQSADERGYYKSVFFINTKPDYAKFGQKPRIFDPNAFVYPLVKKKESDSFYTNLALLPNMKLMEIVPKRKLHMPDCAIDFKKDRDSDIPNNPLSSLDMQNAILRMILSNFLHCILNYMERYKKATYLRLMLMVPNVFSQTKIHQLMCNIHEDFNIIQQGESNYSCRGIEIQVISESDASFLGIMSRSNNGMRDATDGLFLVIDAGKGTTDFSILQQHDNFTSFSSLFRDGIPVSGNYLTYAFFEALYRHLKDYGIDLIQLLTSTSTHKSELLNFMDCLEQFKRYFNKQSSACDAPKKENINNMTDLLTYLDKQLTKDKPGRLPYCEIYVEKRTQKLTDYLEKSLKKYMSGVLSDSFSGAITKKSISKRFVHVLLTGRGFLFDPFAEKVIKMLNKNGWMWPDDDDEGSDIRKETVKRIKGEDAKTLCLEGALAFASGHDVNSNTSLIGSPFIHETPDAMKTFLKKLRRKNNRNSKKDKHSDDSNNLPHINMDFFYDGLRCPKSKNITIEISGREYKKTMNQAPKRLFFVGDKFICQEEDSMIVLDKEVNKHYESIEPLVMNSLFPFAAGSIPNQSEMDIELGIPASATNEQTV